jgi:hypothetical protein
MMCICKKEQAIASQRPFAIKVKMLLILDYGMEFALQMWSREGGIESGETKCIENSITM